MTVLARACVVMLLAVALAACSGPTRRSADGHDEDLRQAVSTTAEALLDHDLLGGDGSVFEVPADDLAEGAAVATDTGPPWVAPAYEPVFLLPAPRESDLPSGALGEAFRARDASVRDVLALLLDDGELGFLLSEGVSGHVSFDMRPGSRAEALLDLLEYAGLTLDVSGRNAEVRDRVRRRLTLPATLAEPDAAGIAQLRELLHAEGQVLSFGGGHLELDIATSDEERVMARLDSLPASRLGGRWVLRAPSARLASLPEDSAGVLDKRALARVMAWRALDHTLAGRHASAVIGRDDALALDPTSPLAQLVDGLLALMAGAGGRAAPSMNRAVAARPDCALTLTVAALVRALDGDFDAAATDLADVATRWPGPASAHNLAAVLILAGRLDDALDVARGASGELAELNMLRAWLYVRAEWLDAALGELTEALQHGARDDDPSVLRVRQAIEALADRAGSEVRGDGVRTEFEDGWH